MKTEDDRNFIFSNILAA
uniref:Macaca fascicularis brain cDNA, clone: QflA-21586 n=1 Tax=Macaca fascicularis TaxID=9541 RepID=I7GNM9_MACFA|nr:unnamed protein product [Macaca fascicularis]